MAAIDAPAKAGRREWFGLAVLALPTFVVAIDLFVLMLALPSLAVDLGAGSNQQLWIMDMYGFLLAGFLIIMGTLGDRIGRRKVLLIGAVMFTAAALFAAYSTSPEMLITARALLGIAGAMVGPSALGLITALFHDPRQRATALGLWSGTFTLGAIFGPVIGGIMVAYFWWGSVFLLGVPVMLLVLVLGPVLLPESQSNQPGKLDAVSVLLSLAALLPLIYGVKELARNGWETLSGIAVVFGILAGAMFLRRQLRLHDPLLDLKLFRNRAIGISLTGQLSYSMVGGGIMLFMMLYFQLVAGMSTLQAGLAMVPGMAVTTLGFSVAPKLAGRFPPAYVIAGGLIGAAAALLVMTQISVISGTVILIVGFAVMGFCGAPMPGLGTTLVMGSAPSDKASSAGSLTQMANEFGGTLGFALLGTLGTAVYRNQVAGNIPADVPAEAAVAARDSLPGAAAAAGELPAGGSAALLDPAYAAFVNGTQVVALVGAVVVISIALLVAFRLRHLPPIGQSEEAASPTDEPDAVDGAPVAAHEAASGKA